MFVQEQGSDKVRWLTSHDTKVTMGLHFVVNEQVCIEFDRKLRDFSSNGKIPAVEADRIGRVFNRDHRNKCFQVVGQKIISNTKQEKTLNTICQDLNLRVGQNDWDGRICQSIVNALAFLGGASHPILVTCDGAFGRKAMSKGYRVIDPARQSLDEIRAVISQQII